MFAHCKLIVHLLLGCLSSFRHVSSLCVLTEVFLCLQWILFHICIFNRIVYSWIISYMFTTVLGSFLSPLLPVTPSRSTLCPNLPPNLMASFLALILIIILYHYILYHYPFSFQLLPYYLFTLHSNSWTLLYCFIFILLMYYNIIISYYTYQYINTTCWLFSVVYVFFRADHLLLDNLLLITHPWGRLFFFIQQVVNCL